MSAWVWLKGQVKKLKRSITALYYAAHDPRTGWLPRILAAIALAYALSPLDLIPDFIPVLGMIDDLLILPGLIWLAVWLILPEAWESAKERAEREPIRLRENWVAAVCVFIVWDSLAVYVLYMVTRSYGSASLQDNMILLLAATGGILVLCEITWNVWKLKSEARQESDARTPDAMEEGLLSQA
ncbi:g8738 [Coccomyxa viridis]|uniref:G8738 protein n=1 Tax=Coccomyxa viridis TaxID=1274662 RepID=A0ABP1G590_9CHLO